MSSRRCCVPKCEGLGVTLHLFPHPLKESVRFAEWMHAIGGDIVGLSNEFIFSNRRVCHHHFEEKYWCRSGRLSNVAVPTLNLPGSTSLAKCTQDAKSNTKQSRPCTEVPTPIADVVMHVFPNPHKYPERFQAWVSLVGGNFQTLSDDEIYKKKRICDIHFTDNHRNRFKRLNALAVPSIHLPNTSGVTEAATGVEVQSVVSFLINAAVTLDALSAQESIAAVEVNIPPVASIPVITNHDQLMKKMTVDSESHVDHNYAITESEDPLRERLTSNTKSQGKTTINLGDPLIERLTGESESHVITLTNLEDPSIGRLTHDKSDDETIDSEDPLSINNKSNDDIMIDMDDPLAKKLIDDTESNDETMIDSEDPLIEKLIDDFEVYDDDTMIYSEDPLKERLNDSKLYYDDDMKTDSEDTMSESDDGLLTAKYKLLELFASLDDSELESIEQWICSKAYKKDLEQKISLLKKENTLIKISKTLKKVLPFEAELPSEEIIPPTVGSQSDCKEYNTCHIDEFLYDEDEVEKLVETGKVKRHYCLDCHSRNTKALTYISHSMSRQAVQYIFTVLLPKELEDKQVLDVGSRIGAVLYGAYYFSNAGTIIGIEMNKECCDITERIISEYSIDNNRMKVVHSDVMNRSDIVSNSDIIVINNPDFFIDVEKHKNMWYFFKKHIKKGSYLVSSRSVTDTLESLGILDELIDWLIICKPNQQENEILFDIEDYSDIFLYTVNKK